MSAETVARRLNGALFQAKQGSFPFRHWTLSDILPEETVDAVRALPFTAPQIEDTGGRRETHNASRRFFGAEDQAKYPVCAEIAAAYQDPRVVARIQSLCGVDLTGAFLRIEYCLDRKGFWLEPHTDIGAKLYTQLIYLSTEPGSEGWGTDLMTPDGTMVARAHAALNSGLIFIPAQDTWHGFAPRKIDGVRRTLIVNYVRDEWRARHELCFPDRPVSIAV